MQTKTVEKIISPPAPHMVGDGFRVHGFIPSVPILSFQRMDPFLVLDYGAKFTFPPSDIPRGVGVHPHKGFETVTIAYKGKVAHQDSSGGGGVIGEGDIQWMTAGSGILHKEYHEAEWSKHGGEFQMVQLWVNLPRNDKKHPPRYQSIKFEDIHRVTLANNAGIIEVIAGKYGEVTGNSQTFSPVNLMNAKLKKGGIAKFDFPKEYATALIVIEGSIRVNKGELIPQDHFVLMRKDGEEFNIQAVEDAIVLVMSGKPHQEPIAAYGPFVMNTQEELIQAFDDYNHGKFGYLE